MDVNGCHSIAYGLAPCCQRRIHVIYIYIHSIVETETLTFWRNFSHGQHWMLSKWQRPVQPVTKISSKWRHRHFRFSVTPAKLLYLTTLMSLWQARISLHTPFIVSRVVHTETSPTQYQLSRNHTQVTFKARDPPQTHFCHLQPSHHSQYTQFWCVSHVLYQLRTVGVTTTRR